MNGTRMKEEDLVWSPMSYQTKPIELYDSMIINHPLIDKNLKELWLEHNPRETPLFENESN